jgi:hypothetical protein
MASLAERAPLTAALPIKVSTTRRERFMMQPLPTALRGIAHCTAIRQAKRGDFTASFGSAAAKAERMAERTEEAAGHAG